MPVLYARTTRALHCPPRPTCCTLFLTLERTALNIGFLVYTYIYMGPNGGYHVYGANYLKLEYDQCFYCCKKHSSSPVTTSKYYTINSMSYRTISFAPSWTRSGLGGDEFRPGPRGTSGNQELL